jgi:hypothetical protein
MFFRDFLVLIQISSSTNGGPVLTCLHDLLDLGPYRFYGKYIVYTPRPDSGHRHVLVVCGSRVLGDCYAAEFVQSGQCRRAIRIHTGENYCYAGVMPGRDERIQEDGNYVRPTSRLRSRSSFKVIVSDRNFLSRRYDIDVIRLEPHFAPSRKALTSSSK